MTWSSPLLLVRLWGAGGATVATAFGRVALQRRLERVAEDLTGDRRHQLWGAGVWLGRLALGGELDAECLDSELARLGRALGLAERDVRRTLAAAAEQAQHEGAAQAPAENDAMVRSAN